MTLLKKKLGGERLVGILAVVTIVLAWFLGTKLTNGEVGQYLPLAFPQAGHFESIDEGTFSAYQDDTLGQLLGYVSIGEAVGYGGPMKVVVGTDLNGNISGVVVMAHKETPAWYDRVIESDYIKNLLGKSYKDGFVIGGDVDGVTGATYTSRAVANAALQASRSVASAQLGLPVPQEMPPKIQFGFPEITLIGLYVVGYIGHHQKFKYKKQARWLSMIVGLVVLGFIYTRPLTLSDISKLLMGFWPQWQTNLYWYLLIGGILFVYTLDNKNPYCEWFCPFGAAQECLGAIGGARTVSLGRFKGFLKWLQRGLAWAALILAFLFRNPGLTSYEIFGTFFDLEGNTLQFALLIIVLVVSLFVRRPWCHYLCPLRPVTDLYRAFRNWIVESWKILRKNPGAQ